MATKPQEKKAIYPGSFDPITLGHIDIINRALEIFDKLVVAVGEQREKNPLFTREERVEIIKELFRSDSRVEVISFDTLLVDLARAIDVRFIVRGLRAISDFEYEFQLALVNRKLYPELESVYLMPSSKFIYLNSTLVKTIASFDGKLSCFVPHLVERRLKEKFSCKES